MQDDVRVQPMPLDEVLAAMHDGAVVVDARDDAAFAAGHLRGSVNVGLGGRFAEYAGEIMTPGTPIVLVTDPGHETEAAVRLSRIGFDHVLGALHEPVRTFLDHPEVVEPLSRLSAAEFDERRATVADLVIIDVRNTGEVAEGAIEGSVHITVAGAARPRPRPRLDGPHRRPTAPAATVRPSRRACCARTASSMCPTSSAGTPPGRPTNARRPEA